MYIIIVIPVAIGAYAHVYNYIAYVAIGAYTHVYNYSNTCCNRCIYTCI